MIWSAALVAAIFWPSRIIGVLDGAPLDRPVEILALAILIPALWAIEPRFLRSRSAKALIGTLLVWKIATWFLVPQSGWCGSFLTITNPATEEARLAEGWDARTFPPRAPPMCTAIISRAYDAQTDFPAWTINLPLGYDRNIVTGEVKPVDTRQPPDGTYALDVRGSFSASRSGVLRLDVGEDTRLTGDLDGNPVTSNEDVKVAAGRHRVRIHLELRGERWRFVPRWNGSDLFSAVATRARTEATAYPSLESAARWIPPLLIVALTTLWIQSARTRFALTPASLWPIAVVAIITALLGLRGRDATSSRLAPLALLALPFVRVPQRLRNGHGAWLLLGLPWLALIAMLVLPLVGRVTIYTIGDDWTTFQRYAYRIVLQGYWLEGGSATFWQQPLYRWMAGTLHVIFGDSSAGEIVADGFGLLIGAMFAFHVTRRAAGFRAGVAAASLSLITVALGPNWYLIGRGLSEIAASAWIYLAAICLLRARSGSVRFGAAAGVFGALAFYTRLNHLPLVILLIALLVPASTEAITTFDWRGWWRRSARVPTIVYLTIIAVALGLFATRTWYYTGQFSITAGTTRVHNATGLGLTAESWLSAGAWRRAIESVLMIVTVQDPPRFDPRSVLVVTGVIASLLALCHVPVARRLPLGVVLVCVGAVVGGFVARGVAYPGRFSIHLIPVAVAVSVSFIGLTTASRVQT